MRMISNKKGIRNALPWIIACICFVIFPGISALAVKKAISIWINAVLPGLLPFFIISNILREKGLNRLLPVAVYPAIMAVLSGYPMGAQVCGDYIKEELITTKEAKRIISYSMVTSPAFLIGVCGIGFFQSRQMGEILVFSHYGGALLTGFFYRLVNNQQNDIEKKKTPPLKREKLSINDCILLSFRSVALILAFMIMFIFFSDLVSTLIQYFVGEDGDMQYIRLFVKGMGEMTIGMSALSSVSFLWPMSSAIAGFFVSFGGFSVIGQTYSILRDAGITLQSIVLMKSVHGLFSALIGFLAGNLLWPGV